MPGYKRIVSYIYTYEKGERKENVGFVKLEARDEECRIAIHMRGFYAHGQVPYKAYLYAPGEDCIWGVFLGELENRNGALEWKGSLGAEDLKRMPYSFKDVRGIWIGGSGGKRYASEWEGHPVKVDSFRVYEEAEEAADMDSDMSMVGERKETTVKIESSKDIREEIAERESEKTVEEPLDIQEVFMPENTLQQGLTELSQEQTERPQEQTEILQEQTDLLQAQTELEQSQVQSDLQKVQRDPQHSQMEKALSAQEENGLGATGEEQPQDRDSRLEKWEYLARRFPVQRLFQNGKAPMFCIRIGPRDLQRLPRGNWILGNNSFLLHGYYQYRHLLLCRQEEDGKIEYYLAVPGVYNEREQMMANLFGFEEFRRSRNAGNRGGNYGYWFRKIEEAVEEA